MNKPNMLMQHNLLDTSLTTVSKLSTNIIDASTSLSNRLAQIPPKLLERSLIKLKVAASSPLTARLNDLPVIISGQRFTTAELLKLEL
jgi:hypothetical protein